MLCRLTSTSTCTRFVIAGGSGGGQFSYETCAGVFVPYTDLPENTFIDFDAKDNSYQTTGNITIITQTADVNGATAFSWLGCNGTPLTMDVDSNDPRVVCSQNIPVILRNGLGSVTPGASCKDFYYKATECNTGDTVFLSGNTSLGLFSIGNVVYYNENSISGSNSSVRRCAKIIQINLNNGDSGDIVGQASGCKDATNCPQENNFVWMFTKSNDQSDSVCLNGFCDQPVFSTQEAVTNIMAVGALFFRDPSYSVPFNGQNKYYGFRKPINQGSGLPYAPAIEGSPEGWVQINNEGRAISFSMC